LCGHRSWTLHSIRCFYTILLFTFSRIYYFSLLKITSKCALYETYFVVIIVSSKYKRWKGDEFPISLPLSSSSLVIFNVFSISGPLKSSCILVIQCTSFSINVGLALMLFLHIVKWTYWIVSRKIKLSIPSD